MAGYMELMLPSSSHRFSGSRLWKDCLGGRGGLVGRPGFISQGLGSWTSHKGMFSVSIRLFWLLVMNIIPWVFAKICFCWAIPLLSVQSRPVGRTRGTRQLQSWQISVCCGWNLGTFLCLVGVHGVCFLHVHLADSLWHAYKRCSVSLADLGRNSELHAWFDAFPVSASSLWWTMTVLCRNPITQWACPLLYPSLSAFQHADGCLAHYLGKKSPPVICDIQGPYQM